MAEESGLIDDMGKWALAEARRHARRWQPARAHDLPFYVSVNLSPRQLADPSLLEVVQACLAENDLAAQTLTLEVTESALMGETVDAARVLGQLHALGVGLSLDDFGTGYSSLGRLRAFPFTMVKIDRSFVAEIDHGATAVVEAALALAGSLELDSVAEGIETSTQFAALRARGCAGGQGHLFSRPIRPESFTALLEGTRTGEVALLPGARRVGSVAS